MDNFLQFILWPIAELVWGMESWRGSARRDVVRMKCVYCRHEGAGLVTCVRCRAPHHRECARFNRKCAVSGCRNRRFLDPAA